jgi:hypothetical protein
MVRTDLGRHFTQEDVEDLMARAKAATESGEGSGLPPMVEVEVGAATSVWAAIAAADAEGGSYCADCAVAEAKAYALDPAAAARLWSLSEQLVAEPFPEPK